MIFISGKERSSVAHMLHKSLYRLKAYVIFIFLIASIKYK